VNWWRAEIARPIVARVMCSLGLTLWLSGAAHAISCSALDGRRFDADTTIVIDNFDPGQRVGFSVPLNTIIVIQPMGLLITGPANTTITLTSASFTIKFDAVVGGPITVLTSCTGSAALQGLVNALSVFAMGTTTTTYAALMDQQLLTRLQATQGPTRADLLKQQMADAERRAKEQAAQEKNKTGLGIFNNLNNLTQTGGAIVQNPVGAGQAAVQGVHQGLTQGVSQIPGVISQGAVESVNQIPASAADLIKNFLHGGGLWYAPEDSAPPVKRFSDGPGSPWRDATFKDALGYASPAQVPGSGSGRLPGLRTDPRATWSMWAEGIFTSFDRRGAAATDGHIVNLMGGVDYRFSRQLVAGAALGYEDQRFDTSFNAGRLRGRGATLAAYAGYLLSPQLNLMASVSAGAAFLNYDVLNSGVSGSYDAQRAFVTASLIRNWYSGPWRVTPRATLFYANEWRNGFTFSDGTRQPYATVNIGRLSLGPEAGYRILTLDGSAILEPSGFIALDCDLTQQQSIVAANGIVVTDNACGGRVGGGLNVSIPDQRLSGLFGFSYNSLFRSEQNSWTLSGRLGREF